MDENVNETIDVDIAQTWPDATLEELEELIKLPFRNCVSDGLA